MPPVGNFAIPASNSKGEKKRRNAPGVSGSASTMAESSARGMGPGGPNSKVCLRSYVPYFIAHCNIHWQRRAAVLVT
jgi:hypothetical protein